LSRETLGFLIGLVAIVIFGASLPSTRLSVAIVVALGRRAAVTRTAVAN